MKKQNRKLGKIYSNKDEQGNTLTYSVLYKLSSGDIIEFERNTRRELECFSSAKHKVVGLEEN